MKGKINDRITGAVKVFTGLLAASLLNGQIAVAKPLVHDAEYYVLEKQNGETWALEDKGLDKRLAEFRKKNGGKSPNIFYILIDDIGFGDLGEQNTQCYSRLQNAQHQ